MDKASIQALIPHAGAMCLLERVVSWDDDTIHCQSASHRRADHPLRRQTRLATVHLVEYGAQAVAVHGGLRAGVNAGAGPGLLAALRDIRLSDRALATIDGVLDIYARRELASPAGLIYRFEVCSDALRLAAGRLTIATAAPA